MKRLGIFLFSFLLPYFFIFAQTPQSPEQFLGYSTGKSFTYHHQVETYFKHLDATSDQVKLQYYGTSYEGRPLFVVLISSSTHLTNLESIRQSNRSRAGLDNGTIIKEQPVIVWMSYNIHGNEAVSTETAMLSAYELISDPGYKTLLEGTLIVIDPCLNPDGHTRYVQFYTEKKGLNPDIAPFSEEHQENWPGGRPNHYLFDLNRDWAWQTQRETQQRIGLLNAWLPQVHVDFHEMGIDAPYFFSPAAEPYHEDVTPWQRDFQQQVGRYLGKAFDEEDWLYFTAEVFDLFYPSYGDTYPTYNGAIGMTYEQGGSGRAGLAVLNSEGDTLTLTDRILHHHKAGLKTIEVSFQQREKLLQEFQQYFTESVSNPPGWYKSYIVKEDHPKKMAALTDYLKANEIQYGYASTGQKITQGFSYKENKEGPFSVEKGDLVLYASQPKSRLLKILFEPNTHIPDSNTYDITAWSLPYAWDLNAFASKVAVPFQDKQELVKGSYLPADSTIALILPWHDVADGRFLATALQKGLQPRISEKEIQIEGKKIPMGSPIFLRKDLGKEGMAKLNQLADQESVSLISLSSSFPEKGPSFGSGAVRRIDAPRVGIVIGSGFSTSEIGEIWHLFEQDLGYPIHRIPKENIRENVLKNIDVLFVSSTYDMDWFSESRSQMLREWVRNGGRLILQEGAVNAAAQRGFTIKVKKETGTTDSLKKLEIKPFAALENDQISRQNPGSIFRLQMDSTHPLAYGYSDHFYILKTNQSVFDALENGSQVGIHTQGSHISGFIGHKIKNNIIQGMSIGSERIGKGHVVYMVDNPIFRSFWRSGKLLLANATFLMP